MDDWIEDQMGLEGEAARASRVLDQHMIREPIRFLNPRPPLSLAPTAPVRQAIALMREHRVGCVLVAKGGRLVGILTERDLLLKEIPPDSKRPLGDLMTPDPEVLSPDDPIVYALNKMSVGGFRHVPLVDQSHRPVGVISVKNVVEYIVDFFPNDVLTVPPRPSQRETWRGREGG